MIRVIDALSSLGIEDIVVYGRPSNESEFNQMVKKVIGKDENGNAILSSDPSDFGVTWSQVEAKKLELEAAEPMRLLREERNRLLSETDWWAVADRTMTAEQTTYRNALRDLPANSTNVALDDNGNLINVTWPTKPE